MIKWQDIVNTERYGDSNEVDYDKIKDDIKAAIEWLKEQELFIAIKTNKNPCLSCGIFTKVYYKIKNNDYCTRCALHKAFEGVMNDD